jgi:hypothetical protein
MSTSILNQIFGMLAVTNKFTVSPRDNPKPNADGSLTLYFQNESPGVWLPAPKGDFLPMLRMYWPKDSSPSILHGSLKPPAVKEGDLSEAARDDFKNQQIRRGDSTCFEESCH